MYEMKQIFGRLTWEYGTGRSCPYISHTDIFHFFVALCVLVLFTVGWRDVGRIGGWEIPRRPFLLACYTSMLACQQWGGLGLLDIKDQEVVRLGK